MGVGDGELVLHHAPVVERQRRKVDRPVAPEVPDGGRLPPKRFEVVDVAPPRVLDRDAINDQRRTDLGHFLVRLALGQTSA
jgi:hypothetical protein